jgi:hypothetical protein
MLAISSSCVDLRRLTTGSSWDNVVMMAGSARPRDNHGFRRDDRCALDRSLHAPVRLLPETLHDAAATCPTGLTADSGRTLITPQPSAS